MLDLDDVAATSPQAQTELAELRARLAEAERALRHVLTSAQTGTYDGGVVISFAALAAVRTAVTADSASADRERRAGYPGTCQCAEPVQASKMNYGCTIIKGWCSTCGLAIA